MVDLPGPLPVRGPASPQRAQAHSASNRPSQASSDLGGKSLPQLVSLAAELSNAPPPVDHARIAEIRAAISNGSYRIDPDAIARALLGGSE